MATTQRQADLAAERAQRILIEYGRDVQVARRGLGASQQQVGDKVGISHSHVSRIEHGLVPALSIELACRIAAVVGLDLSVRSFPGGAPIRDIGQARLLQRFRPTVADPIEWQTEVAVGGSGDPRAWDVMLRLGAQRVGVEAETRVHDWQALDRRIALRRRDSGVETVILVLADTRHNRATLRALGPQLTANFPEPSWRALAAIRRGELPARSTILLV